MSSLLRKLFRRVEELGKAPDDWPPTFDLSDRPLPRNIARCPVCAAKVRIDLEPDRPNTHRYTVDCLVRRTAQEMHDRGWCRAEQWGPVLERAGLPVERAPINKTQVTYEEAPEPWKSNAKKNKRGTWSMVDVPIEGPWAQREHVEVAREVSAVDLPAPTRRALILRMIRDPETRAAVNAAKAMGGAEALKVYGRKHNELAMEALGPEPARGDLKNLAQWDDGNER